MCVLIPGYNAAFSLQVSCMHWWLVSYPSAWLLVYSSIYWDKYVNWQADVTSVPWYGTAWHIDMGHRRLVPRLFLHMEGKNSLVITTACCFCSLQLKIGDAMSLKMCYTKLETMIKLERDSWLQGNFSELPNAKKEGFTKLETYVNLRVTLKHSYLTFELQEFHHHHGAWNKNGIGLFSLHMQKSGLGTRLRHR